MKTPDLSIIIASYNSRVVTQNCLSSIFTSLAGSRLSAEVIIVDNHSADGSVEMLKTLQIKHSELKLVENKENVGFGKANNQAVKEAKSDYLLFLNSDIIVLDSAIESLLNFYKDHEDRVHFVGGKLLNKDMSIQPSAGAFYSLPVVFATLFLRGNYWGLTRYSPNKPKKIDWVSGACILTKKKLFEELGGFDEGIFMYMEEVDLLLRANQAGYQTWFCPGARFIHLEGASSDARSYRIVKVFEGFVYLYKKHRSKLALQMLTLMLQLKSLAGLGFGRLTGNKYLKETYEKALKVAQTS